MEENNIVNNKNNEEPDSKQPCLDATDTGVVAAIVYAIAIIAVMYIASLFVGQ